MIELVIVDDHPLILDGMKTALKENKEIMLRGVAESGIKLLEMLKFISCDVIIMDINMPDMDGIEATQQVLKKHPEIKIIAFSQYDDKHFIRRMLKSGARGYLLKNTSTDEIINAIKEVNRGVLFLGNNLPNLYKKQDSRKGMPLISILTKREQDVLKLICQEKSTKEIASELFISIHTVETHRANLLSKIKARNTAGIVKWAIQNDLSF